MLSWVSWLLWILGTLGKSQCLLSLHYFGIGFNFAVYCHSEFGLAFMDAKERCNARTRHGSFDTSVLEIKQSDLKQFLVMLCEGADGY